MTFFAPTLVSRGKVPRRSCTNIFRHPCTGRSVRPPASGENGWRGTRKVCPRPQPFVSGRATRQASIRRWFDDDVATPSSAGRFWRNNVERCAVCDLDVRLGEQLLGVEAAHIQWHSHAGPDKVANGLALCLLHHKALDCGALGLEERKGTGFNVLVSRDVREWRGETAGSLIEFSGRRIRPPRTTSRAPAPTFVNWHHREVFCSPPR